MKATLIRTETSDEGTFGELTIGNGVTYISGELPWKNNQHKISCIPAGTYSCTWHNSPSKGWVYMVNDIPNRSEVLIHAGNYCGDASEGLETDFEGCIGLGLEMGELNGQKIIADSKRAIQSFENVMSGQEFELTISWADGIGENA